MEINQRIKSLFISELFSLSARIVKDCESIFREAKDPAEGYMIQVSDDIHAWINSVIINAANIDKLIGSGQKKKRNESNKSYEMRIEREKFLNQVLKGLIITEIKNKTVRNKIEHFDEYMDDMAIQLLNKDNKLSNMYKNAIYNMTFSSREAVRNEDKTNLYPLRLYISKEKTFYHMEWSINLRIIYNEAKNIKLRMREITGQEEPGGMMIPLY